MLEESSLNITSRWSKDNPPQAGDSITGTIVDISDATSDYGEYPLLVIKDEQNELIALHCFHLVLKNDIERKIARRTLVIGGLIAVTYHGEKENKNPSKNAANMYRVIVRPPAAKV